MQIIKGLDWAISQDARIVNMSFAGPKDPTLAKAFKAAYDKGVVLIAAAGNAGPKSPPLYPGADPNVIAVSAIDEDDQIYTNSNRGKYVSVAAPGRGHPGAGAGRELRVHDRHVGGGGACERRCGAAAAA